MKRQFATAYYFLIIVLLSWPFQIAYFFFGKSYKFLLLISMVMVGVGTFVCGKWIFKDGFKNAGWSWGKPKHYFYVFALALFLWLFPSIIERSLNWFIPISTPNYGEMLSMFVFSFIITIIPAFGEEFGWRGYLLPRLLEKFKYRKALLIHGFITWIWHLPFIIIMGLTIDGNPWITIPIVATISFIPTILHAVLFAFIWSRTASLAVSTMYHVSFDEVRDTLENSVELGVLGQNWQMLVLTVIGIFLLFKVKWDFSFKTYNYE